MFFVLFVFLGDFGWVKRMRFAFCDACGHTFSFKKPFLGFLHPNLKIPADQHFFFRNKEMHPAVFDDFKINVNSLFPRGGG